MSGHTGAMKRMMILCMAALLLLVLLPKRDDAPAVTPAEGVLRLHILANSDSEGDQAIKLRVRDALLPLFAAAESYGDARAFVQSHGAELLAVCQNTLAEAGAAYGAQLLLGVDEFPDRTYGGVLFPAGAYDALKIVLGDGAGHNWWCVLFPPLCVITPDGAPPADNGYTFESDLLAFFRRWFKAGRT